MTMENILTKAAEQAPSLVVLCGVVWLFLKHLRGYNVLLRDMNNENSEARQHSRDVIEKNTAAVGQNTEVMHTAVKLFQDWRETAGSCAATAKAMAEVARDINEFKNKHSRL